MSGPKHTPTPARDAALHKAWVEHPELDNEERSAFICGFEAGWNAAAPRLAEELAAWRAWAERWGRDIETSVSISPITHNELVERLAATNAALREAGVS